MQAYILHLILLAAFVACIDEPEFDIDKLVGILKSKKVHTRIIGGEQTTNEAFGGFIVAIFYNKRFVCGGSLIDQQLVITAAHCFVNREDVQKWEVVGNISSLLETGVRSNVSSIIIPKTFDAFNMKHDVAILRLVEPIQGDGIKTVQLCKEKLAVGTNLSAAGWGLIDTMSPLPHTFLQKVELPVIDQKKCIAAYKHQLQITNSMICAGLNGKKDSCTFDSGGPIVYYGKSGPELCGIVSFGVGCASPEFPGVYTNISYVKPFIMKYTNKIK